MKPELIEELAARMRMEFDRYENQLGPPENFPALPDIDADRYVSKEFFSLENEQLWSNAWLFAGHVDEVAETGGFKLWQDAGVPIIIVRGADDEIRAFYNTCSHRGGPVVREASGQVQDRFVCKYHRWTYDLAGELIFVPDEHEFPHLDKSCRGLKKVRCERWGNWIWINLNEDAPPLADYLGVLVEEWGGFEPEKLALVEKHSIEIACNWKIAVEAFQEVYHLKHIHPQTVDALINHRGANMGLFENGHSRMIVPNRGEKDEYYPQSPQSEAARKAGEISCSTSLSYSIFPNLITPTGPGEFPFLVFWPESINRTRMDVWWWAQYDNCDPDSEYWQQRLAQFDVVLGEDVENLPFIQQSCESPAFTGVPLSYQERRIYHHNVQVDRTIGVDLIPERLRVPPLLDHLIEA